MEAIILITQRQEEAFHKAAAEFGIGIRPEGSSVPAGKYYIASVEYIGELFSLGVVVGFNEGLQSAAGTLSKVLQN